MSNFIGEYICKVDAKGRILFPAVFKRQMQPSTQERFVIKKDIYENCLVMYPIEEWERQNQIIRKNINPYNKEHNMFIRGFYKGTAEMTLDANNRLLIPRRLLEEVGIDKETILAGQYNKIEVWAKQNYEKAAEDKNFASLAEKIMGGQLNDNME